MDNLYKIARIHVIANCYHRVSYGMSIKLEGFDLNDWTLVGSIRLSLHRLNAKSLPNVVFAVKVVLEKGGASQKGLILMRETMFLHFVPVDGVK